MFFILCFLLFFVVLRVFGILVCFSIFNLCIFFCMGVGGSGIFGGGDSGVCCVIMFVVFVDIGEMLVGVRVGIVVDGGDIGSVIIGVFGDVESGGFSLRGGGGGRGCVIFICFFFVIFIVIDRGGFVVGSEGRGGKEDVGLEVVNLDIL